MVKLLFYFTVHVRVNNVMKLTSTYQYLQCVFPAQTQPKPVGWPGLARHVQSSNDSNAALTQHSPELLHWPVLSGSWLPPGLIWTAVLCKWHCRHGLETTIRLTVDRGAKQAVSSSSHHSVWCEQIWIADSLDLLVFVALVCRRAAGYSNELQEFSIFCFVTLCLVQVK